MEKRLTTAAQGDNPEVLDDSPTNTTFTITECMLYVLVVTLSADNDNKLYMNKYIHVHELPQSHCGDNREGTLFS